MATGSYDKTVKETFPASDAPANTGITGAGKKDEKPKQEDVDLEVRNRIGTKQRPRIITRA
jgi:hypothetical protein